MTFLSTYLMLRFYLVSTEKLVYSPSRQIEGREACWPVYRPVVLVRRHFAIFYCGSEGTILRG